MSRRPHRLLFCLLVLAVVLSAASAFGQDKVSKFAGQLRNNDDFRVRTQAALALGATKSKKAVKPLCAALGDSSKSVRSAAAAALGKLKQASGKSCLEQRLAKEGTGSVKTSIKKALARLEAEAAPAEPTLDSSTRYYVAIKIVDQSGRKVEKLLRGAMSKTAQSLDGYVIAPASESLAEAKKRIAKHKQLKAFLLSPKVTAPKYSDGTLSVKLEVAIFTYPDKNLKGTYPVKLTQQDVSEKDTSSEDELYRMAAQRVIEKFAENVERIQ